MARLGPALVLLFASALAAAQTRPPDPAAPPRAADRAGRERDVVALARLLLHPDPAVRDAAAAGLRALDDVELAFPAVLEALDAGGGPRDSARELLARLGPRAAALVPDLVTFGRSGNEGARDLIVELLGELTPCVRGAEGFLSESSSAGSPRVRLQAARALLIADPTRTAARDLLAAAVRDGTIERDLRLAAALGRAGVDADLAAWVVRALDDEELANKRFAEEVLLHLDARSSAAVPALQSGLRSDLEEVRTGSADALGRIGAGAKAADDALLRLLGRNDPSEWIAAARALARIQPGHAATVARVLGALDEPGRDLDDVAALLAEFEPEAAAREIGFHLDRGDPRQQERTVELAAALVDRASRQHDGSAASVADMRAIVRARALATTAVATILHAAGAVDPEVRAKAVAAAAALPGHDDEVRPLLLAALADGDARVRAAALDAKAKRALDAAATAAALSGAPAASDAAVAARGARALAGALAEEGVGPSAASGAARFSADDLIGMCVLSNDLELAGLSLRDAEIAGLIAAAKEPDEVRARLAARALARVGTPRSAAATAQLADALAAGAPFLQGAAAEVLDVHAAAPDVAIAALVHALAADREVADAASAALVTHGAAAARALAGELAREEPAVRRRAVATLAAMKSEAAPAAPALLALLADPDPDPETARAAAAALLAILGGGELDARLQKLERGR